MTAVDVAGLLEELVATDSENPTLSPGSRGESSLARFVAETMTVHGMKSTLHEVLPDRHNVLVHLDGSPGAPTILYEAHLDTVPSPPGGIPIRRENGRLYGRGSCDTKASLAAMMAAMIDLRATKLPRAAILLAGAVDEEANMAGAAALAEDLPDALGAVIGEPTSLKVVRAHNGFIRVKLHAHGRSAHSSKAHLGQNAVLDASRAVVELADTVGSRLAARSHELVGPALLTPTMISGGIAPNVVPDACEVTLDRRLAPGEDVETALAEIRDTIATVASVGTIHLAEPWVALPGIDTSADHPLVRLMSAAVTDVVGRDAEPVGVTYSTDACRLGLTGGIGCVVFGPGSIDQAHTDDEWVDLAEVETAAAILVRVAQLAAAPA